MSYKPIPERWRKLYEFYRESPREDVPELQIVEELGTAEARIRELEQALQKIDWLSQCGLNGQGQRVYDAANEMKIVEICQRAGVKSKGRQFFHAAEEAVKNG